MVEYILNDVGKYVEFGLDKYASWVDEGPYVKQVCNQHAKVLLHERGFQ